MTQWKEKTRGITLDLYDHKNFRAIASLHQLRFHNHVLHKQKNNVTADFLQKEAQ